MRINNVMQRLIVNFETQTVFRMKQSSARERERDFSLFKKNTTISWTFFCFFFCHERNTTSLFEPRRKDGHIRRFNVHDRHLDHHDHVHDLDHDLDRLLLRQLHLNIDFKMFISHFTSLISTNSVFHVQLQPSVYHQQVMYPTEDYRAKQNIEYYCLNTNESQK